MIIKIKLNKLKKMLNSIAGVIKNKKKESIYAYLLIKIIKNKIFCVAVNEEIELITYDIYENYTEDIDVVLKFNFINEICKKTTDNDSNIYIKKKKEHNRD